MRQNVWIPFHREELAGMLYENSDEPYCEELAKAITDEIRKGNRIDTTTKLRQVIEKTLDFLPEKEKKDTIKKTCQRTFQALRIDVNREFEVLYEFMEETAGCLKAGRTCGNPDVPFRGGQTGQKSTEGRIQSRYLFGLCQRCDTSVHAGVCTEWQSQVNENALGGKSRVRTDVQACFVQNRHKQ